jgi:GxxExxY protein
MENSETSRADLLHRPLTEQVIGIFYDVYNELGHGFLESVYREAMIVALNQGGLIVRKEVPVPVWFRSTRVGDFRCDLVVNGIVLLELKAARNIEPAHEAQTLNYLRATHIEVALLFNFGPRASFRRLVFENSRKQIRENPRASAASGVE